MSAGLAADQVSDVQSAVGMGSEYMRPGSDGGRAFKSPESGMRAKPMMQTSM